MKTLKITFALLTVILLTVSVIGSDSVKAEDHYQSNTTDVDLMVHNKGKLKKPPVGGLLAKS